MPRIAAATVAENREQRRDALLAAAASLIQRGGGFTVAEVAKEVGLSRSAVYEYYGSTGDLIADVLVDEMAAWVDALELPSDAPAPERVRAWITGVLEYVADGRHALVRAAGAIELPPGRRAEVQELHHALIAPLVEAIEDAGSPDPIRDARYAWGAVDAAIARIEAGRVDPAAETAAVIAFVRAGLATSA